MGRVAALVLCAGSSQRFGRDKLDLPLRGKPVWRWAVDAYLDHPDIDLVGVVTSAEKLEAIQAVPGLAFVVAGGATRQESSLLGLRALPEDVEWVLIQDGARPFTSAAEISATVAAVREHGAAVVGLPVTDTVKEKGEEGWTTLDRSRLVAVQTPQAGRRADFLKGHGMNLSATDDVGLLEAQGIHVALVEGNRRNLKLTTQEDYELALRWLYQPMETRTGMGYDVHAFSIDPNRPLWLGGVRFEGAPGLEGHSDADVLLHAIVDAILGAASLGDIGQLYPNTDERWRDTRSTLFLEEAGRRVRDDGWAIVHVDATVLAEVPKVMPRSQEIRQQIASALGLDVSRVSVKATTHEKLGAIGRKEGIVALATATLTRPAPEGPQL